MNWTAALQSILHGGAQRRKVLAHHAMRRLTKNQTISSYPRWSTTKGPGAPAMSALLEIIAQGIFELAGYFAAKVLLPVATLGHVRAERISDNLTFRWHGFKRLPDGTIVVHHEMACLIGAMFLVACVVASVLFWKGTGGEVPGCTRPPVTSEMASAAPRPAPC